MTTLKINQLNATKEFTIASAEQKQLHGGFAIFDNMITNHEKDDQRRELMWQHYADGDANITETNEAFITFEPKDGGKHVLMSVV